MTTASIAPSNSEAFTKSAKSQVDPEQPVVKLKEGFHGTFVYLFFLGELHQSK